MHGSVRVPIQASTETTTSGTPVDLILATGAQKGYVFDVQKRLPGKRWTTFRTDVFSNTTSVTPRGAGRYHYRSRMHATFNDAVSGWSPAVTITVT
jgi:hypothetical protein